MDKIEFGYDVDEMYPVYSLSTNKTRYNIRNNTKPILLTQKEYKDYQKAVKKFNDWQDKIELLIEEQDND